MAVGELNEASKTPATELACVVLLANATGPTLSCHACLLRDAITWKTLRRANKHVRVATAADVAGGVLAS